MAFGKKQNVTAPLSGDSVLKPTISINGDIHMNGPLYLDCKVHGSVSGKSDNSRLIVGPRAEIEGNVTAVNIEVYGSIVGNVDCRSIRIFSKAYVKGNILYQIIEMQPEARIEGEMHNRSNQVSTGPVKTSSEQSKTKAETPQVKP